MRVRACVAVFFAFLMVDVWMPHQALAAPARNVLEAPGRSDHFQLVEDTCWWWGTRWQYGWRGYAWYPCWDWIKPQPTVIAPEEVPEDTLKTPRCVQSWRDPSGNLHSRRIC